jgi:hypothetical protein
MPDRAALFNYVHAVAATSSNDVWAVGDNEYPEGTLIEHYTTVPCGTVTATATPPTNTPTLTSTNTVTPCPLPFTDVNPNDYFYPAVRYLYCRGVISGYGDGTFRPYNNTTRGQLAKIVVLAEGFPIYTPPVPTFLDVPPTDPFYRYIETAYHAGLVSGYGCGAGCLEFRPGNSVTRGQVSKIVALAAGWELRDPPAPTFRDVPVGNTFYRYVETAYCHGIISGYTCGPDCLEFRPGNNVTRGQLSKIIVLAQSWQLYKPPLPTFRDVPPDNPFYAYIETAYSHNIISGYSCGTTCREFRPGNNATRGQICKIVYLAVTLP